MEFREIGKCRLFHFLSCVWEGLATLLNNCAYTLNYSTPQLVVLWWASKLKNYQSIMLGPSMFFIALLVLGGPPPTENDDIGLFLFIHVTHVP